ncbi:MAG: NUDIX domain-containing protein [Firmicutes bacterium]|nr:NUDIX domain-containing protein [Bacillota bacterium]HAV21768.1 NUDIX hydrolase [Bacillota bacterium]
MDRMARKREVSAGIAVFSDDSVLVIRNRFGEWTLPKGKIEPSETPREAALREVLEETGVSAKIICALGTTEYTYVSEVTGEPCDKTVYWYLGVPEGDDLPNPHTKPQEEEGISCAEFISWEHALEILTYEDTKNLVMMAGKLLPALIREKREGRKTHEVRDYQ